MRCVAALSLLLLLLATAASAQAPPATACEGSTDPACAEVETAAKPGPPAEPSPFSVASWCLIDKPPAGKQVDGEGGEPATKRHADPPGCDLGAGWAFHRWGRWHVDGVIGTATVGAGVGYAVAPSFSVAVGVVTPWSMDDGIDGKVYPAIGVNTTVEALMRMVGR